jgi:Cytochrome oxidase complex assembly protein 1
MEPHQQRSWFGRNWKWLLPVGCLLPIVAVGGCVAVLVAGIFTALKSSDAYHLSLEAVRSDEQVIAAIGEPMEPSLLVTGNIYVSTQGGHAEVSYGITGPKGEGTVYANGVKEDGEWKFRSLVVQVESTGEKIDVLDNQRHEEMSNEAI